MIEDWSKPAEPNRPTMSDGKQGVPFDRMLMRIKDVSSILSSWLNIFLSICTIVGGMYFFARKIDVLVQQMSILQQQQSATQQMVVTSGKRR